MFDQASAKYGVVNICVPAAGITRDALAVKIDKETGKAVAYPVETFRQVMEVNLVAPVYWAMEMVARIAEERRRRGLGRWEPSEKLWGTVVFIGSVSSQGNKGQIAYAASKAGLEGAAATLTKEAIFHGVKCAVIHPGFTDTPMVRALGEEFIAKNILPVHAAAPADPPRRDRRRHLLPDLQLGDQRRTVGRRRLAPVGLRADSKPVGPRKAPDR